MTFAIQCHSLTKSYDKKILDNISFDIVTGEKVMLLGSNGAGKTTLIQLMLGIEKPDDGWIKLNSMAPNQKDARLNIGVVPQESDFIDELTVLETLWFVKKHFKDSYSCSELVSLFLLESFKNLKTSKLSVGQKRRLALALAFVNKPEMLFLDEPTVGLDIESRRHIISFLQEYVSNPKVTLFLTTHYLEEAEILTNRIIHLVDDKIKSDCLKEVFKKETIRYHVEFYCSKEIGGLNKKGWFDHIEKHENHYSIVCKDSDALVRYLFQENIPFFELRIRKPTLEEIYFTN